MVKGRAMEREAHSGGFGQAGASGCMLALLLPLLLAGSSVRFSGNRATTR
jgi:hypothetical protein